MDYIVWKVEEEGGFLGLHFGYYVCGVYNLEYKGMRLCVKY